MTKTILSYTKHGALGPSFGGPIPSSAGVRICPWDDTMSRLDGYSAIRVSFTLSLQGFGTLVGRLFEFSNGTGLALQPETARDMNRFEPNDSVTVLDSNTAVSLGQAITLFERSGAIVPITSGPWLLPKDTTNTREWYLQIENLEPMALRYTIDMQIELTHAKT